MCSHCCYFNTISSVDISYFIGAQLIPHKCPCHSGKCCQAVQAHGSFQIFFDFFMYELSCGPDQIVPVVRDQTVTTRAPHPVDSFSYIVIKITSKLLNTSLIDPKKKPWHFGGDIGYQADPGILLSLTWQYMRLIVCRSCKHLRKPLQKKPLLWYLLKLWLWSDSSAWSRLS